MDKNDKDNEDGNKVAIPAVLAGLIDGLTHPHAKTVQGCLCPHCAAAATGLPIHALAEGGKKR